jgi:hypothetical protein
MLNISIIDTSFFNNYSWLFTIKSKFLISRLFSFGQQALRLTHTQIAMDAIKKKMQAMKVHNDFGKNIRIQKLTNFYNDFWNFKMAKIWFECIFP